jgi:hypothetical protein
MISSPGDYRSGRARAMVQQLFCRRRRRFARLTGASAVCLIIAIGLVGCSAGPGTLLADPGRYSVMHCKDLIAQRNSLITREQELRKLQAKASEGTGGAIIGAMAYRADYETALTDQKIVEREAADKNCQLSPTFQSDQTIR